MSGKSKSENSLAVLVSISGMTEYLNSWNILAKKIYDESHLQLNDDYGGHLYCNNDSFMISLSSFFSVTALGVTKDMFLVSGLLRFLTKVMSSPLFKSRPINKSTLETKPFLHSEDCRFASCYIGAILFRRHSGFFPGFLFRSENMSRQNCCP